MKCLFAIIQTALNTTISFYNTVNMTNRFIYNNEQVINNRNFFLQIIRETLRALFTVEGIICLKKLKNT